MRLLTSAVQSPAFTASAPPSIVPCSLYAPSLSLYFACTLPPPTCCVTRAAIYSSRAMLPTFTSACPPPPTLSSAGSDRSDCFISSGVQFVSLKFMQPISSSSSFTKKNHFIFKDLPKNKNNNNGQNIVELFLSLLICFDPVIAIYCYSLFCLFLYFFFTNTTKPFQISLGSHEITEIQNKKNLEV